MTEQPKRIQRSRRKGWRLPPGAKCVTRPGPWGNLFPVQDGDRAAAVEAYRQWFFLPEQAEFRARARRELRGYDLACFCALDKPCHADILLAYANS